MISVSSPLDVFKIALDKFKLAKLSIVMIHFKCIHNMYYISFQLMLMSVVSIETSQQTNTQQTSSCCFIPMVGKKKIKNKQRNYFEKSKLENCSFLHLWKIRHNLDFLRSIVWYIRVRYSVFLVHATSMYTIWIYIA